MCLLAASFKKIQSVEALENGFNNNSDGAGFCYSNEGKLYSEKGFFTFQAFLDAYNVVPDNAPNLVHFRLATGGKRNEENCHPFSVSKKLAFAHNGIFSCVDSTSEHSDTYEFNRLLMQPLFAQNPDLVFTNAAKFLIEKTISYNKVAFLSNKGQITICNEKAGDWDEEIWWSNTGWKYSRNWNCGYQGSSNVIQRLAVPVNKQNNLIPTFENFLKECYQSYLKDKTEEQGKEIDAALSGVSD